MALLQNKQTAEGLAQIDRILKDGDTPEAHLMLGPVASDGGRLRGARDELKKAVEGNPKLPLAHSLYGQALLTTGTARAPAARSSRSSRRTPADFDAHLYLGVILKEDAQLDEAERHFARALQLRPGDPGVRYQLATVHLGRNENDPALALLEPLVRESPTFIEARVSLATVYYRLKRKDDGDRERAAVAELTKAAQARQPTVGRRQRRPAQPPLGRWRQRDASTISRAGDSLVLLRPPCPGHERGARRREKPTYGTTSSVVLLDLVVRDKKGNPVAISAPTRCASPRTAPPAISRRSASSRDR